MYHVLSDPPAHAPYPELYVGRSAFLAQVSWLARHGFRAVTLEQVFAHWEGRGALPRHPVVLSFDDGYRSDYTTGYRVLRERRWPGVLNLELRNTTVPWGLSPAHVRQMIAAGWEVDSHTITHPDLTALDASALHREVAGSRALLRRRFRVPADFFCYPSGRYDAAVVTEVRHAGYRGALTTRFGLARPGERYALARIRVNRSDGVAGLAAEFRTLGLA
jgi:peptidoglycan/xylan/chitin deacetylase (PgdA/CDA1 family)